MKRENTLYYHTDHLGSSGYVTDKKGNFYEHTEYTSSGESWVNEKVTGNADLPYKYTSKEQDAETGLYYYGARYYDARTSRFVSPDDRIDGLFSTQGQNMYMYCHGNPINMVDPDGHAYKDAESRDRYGEDGQNTPQIGNEGRGVIMNPTYNEDVAKHEYEAKANDQKKIALEKRIKEGQLQSFKDKPGTRMPFSEDVKAPVTSSFGRRTHPVTHVEGTFHPGIDLGVPVGTTTRAVDQGRVVYVNTDEDDSHYGINVEILHPNGEKTRYAHMIAINVNVGDIVYRGQKIGETGNTGRSTGPHMHYEIMVDGEVVDPAQYIWRGN